MQVFFATILGNFFQKKKTSSNFFESSDFPTLMQMIRNT